MWIKRQHVFYLFVCWLVEWLVARVFFTSDQMCFSGIIVQIIKTFIIIMSMRMACIMVTRYMRFGERKRFVLVAHATGKYSKLGACHASQTPLWVGCHDGPTAMFWWNETQRIHTIRFGCTFYWWCGYSETDPFHYFVNSLFIGHTPCLFHHLT